MINVLTIRLHPLLSALDATKPDGRLLAVDHWPIPKVLNPTIEVYKQISPEFITSPPWQAINSLQSRDPYAGNPEGEDVPQFDVSVL